ncbi:long-chain fatty acid--CoA ligase [soil metagenome]
MPANPMPTSLVRASGGLTVDAIVRERARMHPHRHALAQHDERMSYGQLMQRVDRLAHALRALGVRRHDRVAVLSENRNKFVEAILAGGILGAIVSCNNWRQSDAELTHCFGLTAPLVVLASERHASRLAGLDHGAAHVVVFGEQYESMLSRAESSPMQSLADLEDGLLIMYTSGTTGFPKAAVLSHRAEIARALIGVVDGQLHPGRGTICWSPLYHIAGCEHALGVLMQGDTVFLTDGFQPAQLVDIMSREELGTVSLMPSAIGRVIDELNRTGLRPKGIKACGSMADLVPRHQIGEVSGLLNAEFRNSFGATETGQPPASRHRFPIGVAPTRLSKIQSSYCAIRLVDTDDIDVPDGTPGEVLVKGPSLFSGYWGAPDVTAEDFRGGWFHMGDMMIRNADGTLDFVDRRKYLIKSGGENIYPAEIERVLLSDSRIKDAAVVRKADAHWGEVPVVFVIAAQPGLTAQHVTDLCRAALAGYKVPKEVHFIGEDEMPRSETSKVKRFELEKRLVANTANAAATLTGAMS